MFYIYHTIQKNKGGGETTYNICTIVKNIYGVKLIENLAALPKRQVLFKKLLRKSSYKPGHRAIGHFEPRFSD